MARGDSIIRVSIIGDAKKFAGAIKDIDTKLGTFGRVQAGVFNIAARGVDEFFDVVKGTIREADRLGDASERLNRQLGPEFAGELQKTANAFTKIGLSTQDMLELEAVFADFATTAGVADNAIFKFAERAAGSAQAFALVDDQGRDASSVLDLITKAAGGSEKAARELGVSLIDTKDAGAQMNNVLTQMQGRLDDTLAAEGDLEQKQSQLEAQWETLSGQLGGPLSEGLSAVLGFILDEIEAIPHAIAGWQMLGASIEGFARTVLGPLGNVRDILEQIIRLLPQADTAGRAGLGSSTSFSERFLRSNTSNYQDRNGLERSMGGP